MTDRSITILRADDVQDALDGHETKVIDAVKEAYLVHRAGRTQLPHSQFLRFGDDNPNRIISLPAFIDDSAPVAGMKWIASFPANITQGIDRASAVLVMNSVETGRPMALLESSVVSARRTAASAALAAQQLHKASTVTFGAVGCGLINFEIVRFVRSVFPALQEVVVFDLKPAAMQRFAERVQRAFNLSVRPADSVTQVFEASPLVAFATVAGEPHVANMEGWTPDTTALHVSLRDLAPAIIRQSDNVVDDINHVFRARTSLHLTEMEDGDRASVRCTLADVIEGEAEPREGNRPVIFSPFGLGVLDLAVARLVLKTAERIGAGTRVPDFLPPSPADLDGAFG